MPARSRSARSARLWPPDDRGCGAQGPACWCPSVWQQHGTADVAPSVEGPWRLVSLSTDDFPAFETLFRIAKRTGLRFYTTCAAESRAKALFSHRGKKALAGDLVGLKRLRENQRGAGRWITNRQWPDRLDKPSPLPSEGRGREFESRRARQQHQPFSAGSDAASAPAVREMSAQYVRRT
jgi:hypothetical protein